VNALGAAMGPVIGGFLTTYFSWRWAFRLEVLALVVILIFHAIIPADQPIVTRARVDTLGTILQAGAMIALVLGILLISDYGLLIAKQPLVVGGIELSPFNLGLSPAAALLGLGLLLLLLFVQVETRNNTENRPSLVHLTLFTIADFVNGLKVRSIQVSAIAGILFTVPLFMQVSFGISAFDTGLALLPLSISIILGAFLGVRLSRARLPIQIVRIGTLVLALGAVIMVARMNTGTGPLDLALGLSVVGLGAGLIGSHIVNLVLSSVSPEETAEASGVTSTLEQLGNSVGVAILGTLLTLALSLGLSQSLAASSVIPEDLKRQAQERIEHGVNIVSDQEIQASLAGYDPAVSTELLRIYDIARTNAFRICMLVVAFCGLLMYLFSFRMPSEVALPGEVALAEEAGP
jgi:predicted MFS family arabinose efflux permease